MAIDEHITMPIRPTALRNEWTTDQTVGADFDGFPSEISFRAMDLVVCDGLLNGVAPVDETSDP